MDVGGSLTLVVGTPDGFLPGPLAQWEQCLSQHQPAVDVADDGNDVPLAADHPTGLKNNVLHRVHEHFLTEDLGVLGDVGAVLQQPMAKLSGSTAGVRVGERQAPDDDLDQPVSHPLIVDEQELAEVVDTAQIHIHHPLGNLGVVRQRVVLLGVHGEIAVHGCLRRRHTLSVSLALFRNVRKSQGPRPTAPSEEGAKRIVWVSLVVDEAVCSHFAGFIALVFIKARSLRSLTSAQMRSGACQRRHG